MIYQYLNAYNLVKYPKISNLIIYKINHLGNTGFFVQYQIKFYQHQIRNF